MLESLLAFKRAGADGILTYFALDAARFCVISKRPILRINSSTAAPAPPSVEAHGVPRLKH